MTEQQDKPKTEDKDSISIKPAKTVPKFDLKKPAKDPMTGTGTGKKEKKKPPVNLEASKYYIGLAVGKHKFNNTNGTLLLEPGSFLRFSSYQHHTCQLYINDEENLFVTEVLKSESEEIKVDLGFASTDSKSEFIVEEKFIGKVYSGGRSLPHGTCVKGVDVSFSMNNSTNTSIQPTGATPEAGAASAGGTTAATSDKQDQDKEDQKKDEEKDSSTENKDKDKDKDKDATSPAKPDSKSLSTTNPTEKTTSQTTTSSTSTQQQSQTGNTFLDLKQMRDSFAAEAKQRGRDIPAAKVFTQDANPKDLEFEMESDIRVSPSGSIRTQQTEMVKMMQEALAQGDIIITSGKQIKQIPAGGLEHSGVTLDYDKNRPAFIGRPKVLKRTGIQLQSGFGAITVSGFDINNKQTVSATAVTPLEPAANPNLSITVPDWGSVKMSDPIYPGCPYNWGDATKSGTRVPTKEIMGHIIAIAQIITKYTEETVGKGNKWTINSWYRPPDVNRRVGGAPDSRHLYGDAVDAYFGNFEALHQKLYASYPGGLARDPGAFIHLDARHLYGKGKSRWVY